MRVFWGMFSDLSMFVALVLILFCVVFYLHFVNSKALAAQITAVTSWIDSQKDQLEFEMPTLDTIRNELTDIVDETLSNLQPPNAFDHFLGAIAPAIQTWAFRKAGINPATGQPIEAMLTEAIDND